MTAMFEWTKDHLTPDDEGYKHRTLEIVKTARTIGGVAMTVIVAIAFETKLAAVGNAMNSTVFNCIAGLGATLIGLIIFAMANRGKSGGGRPAQRTVITILGMAVFYGLIFLVVEGFNGVKNQPMSFSLIIVGLLLGFIMLLVALPLMLWCSYWAFANWFNAADTNPLLPALCTAICAAFVLPYNAVLIAVGPAVPRPPMPVAIAMSLGGPALVLILAVIEIVLARRDGVRLASDARHIETAH